MQPATTPSRRAFTMLELLVVSGIILLLIAITLPAIGRLVESSNYAGAINTVTATLGQARAHAIRTGRPAGVAFLFDTESEQYSLVVVEYEERALSASLSDLAPTCSGRNNAAVAFRPVSGQVPVELPRRTGVFGLCIRTHIVGTSRGRANWDCQVDGRPTYAWYAGEIINGDNSDDEDDIFPWSFPRNDPRLFLDQASGKEVGVDPWDQLTDIGTSPAIDDSAAVRAIRSAESFMIQFSPSGTVQETTALGGQDILDAYLEWPDAPHNLDSGNASSEPYDSINLFDPEQFSSVSKSNRERNPEVRLRSASVLAVVDLSRLQEGVGYRRPWLFRPGESKARQPDWIWAGERLSVDQKNDRVRAASRWIDLNAEIIGFNRYTGNAIRRSVQ